MQKITPCLWFDDNAEEAANFYTSIFKGAKITAVSRYGESGAAGSGRKAGSVMTIKFELEGQELMGLNGGPHFKFSPAISLVVNCTTQQDIDEIWAKMSTGGPEEQCGWLTDKFGVSWQIVPTIVGELMQSKEPGKADRVMAALLKMKKLDLETLKNA